MNNLDILNKLQSAKKGTYIKLKKKKDLDKGIVKESEMVLRIGVKAGNTSLYENKQPGVLPWGHWVEGLENLVIEHKGSYYLRLTSKTPENPEGSADTISTKYLLNGEEINKEEVINLIGEKKLSGKASPFYNVKFENIISLG